MTETESLLKTPLHALHLEWGAKMVPFAGYDMPVQYPLGVLKEHIHTREKAGLFDVSHMGQAFLRGTGAAVDEALETMVPGNIIDLKPWRMRYTQFLNDTGGILDDLMVTRWGDEDNTLFLVVNAACKEQDFALMRDKIGAQTELEILPNRALLALQGPKAWEVLAEYDPEFETMPFMSAKVTSKILGIECIVSRCGYTGEDGFEISIPAERAEEVARALVANELVEPIGLGARDSLRLEVGLCLYGSDLDETTSPLEADLLFSIGPRRREAADFPGGERFKYELANGVSRKRVGILPEGRAPARGHTEIQNLEGKPIGEITSGGFGPSFGGPVAMGYVAAEYAEVGTEIQLIVRGKTLPAKVAAMPFVEQRYYRKAK